jgi:hypothetical protein
MQRVGISRLEGTRPDVVRPGRLAEKSRRELDPHAKHLETRYVTRHKQII